MDGLLKSLTTAFSRITLGRETQAIRDRYFIDAEAAIRNNSQFNWFTAKIAIWQENARKSLPGNMVVWAEPQATGRN